MAQPSGKMVQYNRRDGSKIPCRVLKVNDIYIVGKKETIEIIRSEMREMSLVLEDVAKDLKSEKPVISEPALDSMTERYLAFLEAALWMLKGSSYLWEDKKDGRESTEGL